MSGPPSIRLRPATLDDVATLRRWDGRPHVPAASGDDDDDDGAETVLADDAASETLIAELDGRPIGVVQVIDPGEERTHDWGDVATGLRAIDIWIGDEADLGQGYGEVMMRLALARCFDAPEVSAALIDPLVSNVRAHRFYERIGFTPTGVQRFGTDTCVVHRLERTSWARGRPTEG